jgi:hypothetical protein
VGLHYLKHLSQLSDEDVVEQWVENPYWQYLCKRPIMAAWTGSRSAGNLAA